MQVVKHSERDAEKLLVSKIKKTWRQGPINLHHPAAPGTRQDYHSPGRVRRICRNEI